MAINGLALPHLYLCLPRNRVNWEIELIEIGSFENHSIRNDFTDFDTWCIHRTWNKNKIWNNIWEINLPAIVIIFINWISVSSIYTINLPVNVSIKSLNRYFPKYLCSFMLYLHVRKLSNFQPSTNTQMRKHQDMYITVQFFKIINQSDKANKNDV